MPTKFQKNSEESVVPGHHKKKPIDFNTVNESDYNEGIFNQPNKDDL